MSAEKREKVTNDTNKVNDGTFLRARVGKLL